MGFTVSFILIVGFCKIIAFCLKIIVMPQDFSIRILRKNYSFATNLDFPATSVIHHGKIPVQFQNNCILSQINCDVWFRRTKLWSGKRSRFQLSPLLKIFTQTDKLRILENNSAVHDANDIGADTRMFQTRLFDIFEQKSWCHCRRKDAC